jgi:methylmalonyl-CoA mutase cobalamin-binding subunit
MKIAIIAANGRSGREMVATALSAGHMVRAGVLGPNTFPDHEHLEVVPCDATNQSQLGQLVSGCDAVVSLIGHVRGSDPNVQTTAMKLLIPVLQKVGIRRVVSLTGTGVRQPDDRIALIDYPFNLAISIIDSGRVKDGIMHAKELQSSGLDYSILRVLKLTNGRLQKFSLKEHGPTRLFTSRKTVAAAVLQVLAEGSFKQQMPIIGT